MQPLDRLEAARLASVELLLSDIDDTITSEGRLTAASYGALERLDEAGIKVVPITGRPAGWCDHIARMWPVAGIVGENGAFSLVYDRARRQMREVHFAGPQEAASNRARLDTLAHDILAAVPGAALASDQPYRRADLAIDFCEDVAPLRPDEIARIVALFEAAGATAKVSSIHVNGWFGAYDKLTMTRRLLAQEFGLDLARAGDRVAFIGDSPNDAPMFGALALSVGVANVADFADALPAKPAFITRGRSGAGFVEFAERILDARRRGAE